MRGGCECAAPAGDAAGVSLVEDAGMGREVIGQREADDSAAGKDHDLDRRALR